MFIKKSFITLTLGSNTLPSEDVCPFLECQRCYVRSLSRLKIVPPHNYAAHSNAMCHMKKEHIGTWFCDVSYLYFLKNDLSIVFNCISFGRWGDFQGSLPSDPPSFQSFCFETIPENSAGTEMLS